MSSPGQKSSQELPDIAWDVRNYIAGRFENNELDIFKARNPANNDLLGDIPWSRRATAQRAVMAAKAAQPAWARVPVWERASLCSRLGMAIEANEKALARILSMEQGKPLSEAIIEVRAAGHGFHMSADLVKYTNGEILGGPTPDRQVLSRRFPRGVYAVVTPWNYPLLIPTEYLAPAIVTGNAVAWVPAPTTSVVAYALMRVLAEAGLPDGLINLVCGEGAIVGDEIVGHKDVNAIGFTGSTNTGALIAKRGAGKPMLLELGGNGPLIVRRDADLGKAAAAAALGAFSNSGKICAATGRVLADVAIAAELAERISAIAQTQKLGDPLESDTTMGPLNNFSVLAKVREHVDEAKAAGARCLTGGSSAPELGSELFYRPTVLSAVTSQMRVAREETFGPVVPVLSIDGDDELLRVARETGHGLSMAIFSNDIERALAMSAELPAGIVNINAATIHWETHVPFGGASGTSSGIGRLGGRHALEAMTEVRSVSIPFPTYG
jgi:acyl-CoA reductase-like NAD-dependent aldehyde dehydrogenase